MTTVKTALTQLNSSPDINENTKTATEMIRQAASDGAQLICTPENTCHMRFSSKDKLKSCFTEEEHPALPHYRALAKELGTHLLIGSMTIKLSDDKMANRSFMISDQGDIIARYDKIHLFDVDLPTGESHRESDDITAGHKTVLAPTPWGKIGLSICYDVRFAYLYRKLAQTGASILTVPAAFTVPTGQAHWDVLLRARAIETGSFVLAPAQCGSHEGDRQTYGHSMMIDPWGRILAKADDKPQIISATLNLEEVTKARTAIPALQHDRDIA